jgi:hypothetical protein
MNLSADFLGMLERALQDRYDAGYKEGRLEASIAADETHAEGYAQAMHEVANWALVKTRLPEPEEPAQGELEENQRKDEPEEPTQEVHLSPAGAKIVDYVRAWPGLTAADIKRACGGSNSAIYTLHKLGVVIKKGRQFYPNS